MPQTKAFKFGYAILLIFLIIWVGTKIDFIFQPVVALVQTLFSPFLVAGILYYLFRPLVNYLESRKVRRTLSILLIYTVFGGLLTLLVYSLGPILQRQVNSLVDNAPFLVENARVKIQQLQQNEWVNRFQENSNFNWDELSTEASAYLSSSLTNIGTNIARFIGVVTSIITIFVTVPFILYYMLKEGEKAPQQVLRLLPPLQRENGKKILSDLDGALSSYIQGQVFVSICVGIMLYIGYLIIGIEYSLLLAIIAMFTNVIPFVGPIIAIIPALIVAVLESPTMVVKVLVVMVIAQQLEGNVISPQVMGRSLSIHPLTIISILLVAGSLGGLLGLILAVPVYAVMKVVVQNTYRLWMLRKERDIENDILS
ncbi:AI-2E family transporter [Ectobacillus antri]|jgi:predicted PurR-regulated permease PerM|uniref:AI-2E family transporter n=1 Tax=Ectobacillus antri TaxID=2486280 RepID=A0ABT6H772_9BACI|nr:MULTISPECIES: AI-2E family transporter [Ectobacillus]MDG4657364.1 AI-2E family transporter [Ectobacillus antri]MDG5754505.1 AI-2E family transporter [Ectobacillus antri]UOY91894.1 AI-2E family transporter [Ectobacillus sp. JY-23]